MEALEVADASDAIEWVVYIEVMVNQKLCNIACFMMQENVQFLLTCLLI